MFRKHVTRSIVLIVIVLNVLIGVGKMYAAILNVKLTAIPNNLEVSAGSGRIVIIANVSEKNLTFTWKLNGPGKLEEKNATIPAISYIPPDKVDKKSVQAKVMVTVQDKTGRETKKTITFTIVQNKTGMSKLTKTAIGAGAFAALVGIGNAIRLDSGGNGATPTPEPTPKCSGVEVGGYCWYLATSNVSCNSICMSHGGYHPATETYAGRFGSNDNCYNVLKALEVPESCDNEGVHFIKWYGCGYGWSESRGCYVWHRGIFEVLPDTPCYADGWVCACNN